MVALPRQDDRGIGPLAAALDDDAAFLRRLGRAMARRGFQMVGAESVAAGRATAASNPPACAVVLARRSPRRGLLST